MTREKGAWGAVWALGLGTASQSTAESLPVPLLTPIATDLHVTTGLAGQAVTASAIVALVASLLVASAARSVDRRTLLLSLTSLTVASNLVVAVAPNLPVLLLGRVLLGLAVGSFWALSASLALRLVPAVDVPRALSIIFGGSAVAGIIAMPVGSFLGGIIGWRGVIWAALALSVLALGSQLFALPSMPPTSSATLRTLWEVLRRRVVVLGMTGIFLTFAGHRLFFTYVRPLLDRTTGGNVALISAMLLCFGAASFIGTTQAGRLHRHHLRVTLIAAAATIAVLAFVMLVAMRASVPTMIVLVVWGLAFGLIPVGWSTWITRAVPDQVESAGGLQVAVIQVAIIVAAAGGGLLVDAWGVTAILVATGIVMAIGAAHIVATIKPVQPS